MSTKSITPRFPPILNTLYCTYQTQQPLILCLYSTQQPWFYLRCTNKFKFPFSFAKFSMHAINSDQDFYDQCIIDYCDEKLVTIKGTLEQDISFLLTLTVETSELYTSIGTLLLSTQQERKSFKVGILK